MDMENDNSDKVWNWGGISGNSNLTMETIQNNPEKPWNWQGIRENPNATMNIINHVPNTPVSKMSNFIKFGCMGLMLCGAIFALSKFHTKSDITRIITDKSFIDVQLHRYLFKDVVVFNEFKR